MKIQGVLYIMIVLGLVLSLALGQDYSGRYVGQSATNGMVLELTQQGDQLTGILSGSGIRFEIDGFVYVDEGVAAGAAHTTEGTFGFEAYLQGDTLGLYLFELDANSEPIVDTATELILTRQAPTALPSEPHDANPLDQAEPPTNPLAASDPLMGNFSDGNLTVQIQGGGGRYSGQMQFGGQIYSFTAQGSTQNVSGSFSSGGQAFEFNATLQGDTLRFATGGTSYTLTRNGASAYSSDPLAEGTADSVIAQGAYGSLTEANALAFIEALEFSLEQVGYAHRFTEAERAQLLEAMVQEYPRADEKDQVVLSQAQEIWRRVQAHWLDAAEAEQREFVLGVFVLAFGAEAVQQWVGPAGAGGQGQALGSGSCASFEDCTSQFVDQGTWTDTFNAQGCWAAAGCESYDSSTGSFTYSDEY